MFLLRATLTLIPRSSRECQNGRCQKSLCCCWRELRRRVQVQQFRASPSIPAVFQRLIPFVPLRQPAQPLAIAEGPGAAGQPQNALAVINPSQATPTELTPTALSAPGSLPISSLPARPNLPDDPVIPHNGFATAEEGEKAFFHLLRKAGIDANWTWDQTMRAIITDPLYKALNTLAEKKAAWQKVIPSHYAFSWLPHPADGFLWLFIVHGRLESQRAGGKRG